MGPLQFESAIENVLPAKVCEVSLELGWPFW